MKRCIACREIKSLSEFYEHPQMADGLLGKCKGCCKKSAADRRAARLEEIKEYDRKRNNEPHRIIARYFYARTEKGKDITRSAKREWAEKNPRKRAAQILFRNRQRYDLSLAKQPCEYCGAQKSHAHHENYDKPLEVRWLCPLHHKQRHKEMKAEGIEP